MRVRMLRDCIMVHGWRTSHYSDVIMGAMASQITGLTIVYSNVYSGADQRKLQSSASLAFVRGNHRSPVNSPQKWPVTRKTSIWWRHHLYRRLSNYLLDKSPQFCHKLRNTPNISRFLKKNNSMHGCKQFENPLLPGWYQLRHLNPATTAKSWSPKCPEIVNFPFNTWIRDNNVIERYNGREIYNSQYFTMRLKVNPTI